jgi:hypothetical protein
LLSLVVERAEAAFMQPEAAALVVIAQLAMWH